MNLAHPSQYSEKLALEEGQVRERERDRERERERERKREGREEKKIFSLVLMYHWYTCTIGTHIPLVHTYHWYTRTIGTHVPLVHPYQSK